MAREQGTGNALDRLRRAALAVRRDVAALYLAARDPRVPWYAKAVAAAVAAYALSPVDLIPDFIPVVGYLDDLILVPLGILLAVRLIPAPLLDDLRSRAERMDRLLPRSVTAAVVVVFLWVAGAAALLWLLRGA